MKPSDDATQFVLRCFDRREGVFSYDVPRGQRLYLSRAMAGTGILALAHAGMHNSQEATRSGDWILEHMFDQYNRSTSYRDSYHYGVFHCCQAMYQLGGHHWKQFYPPTVQTLLINQNTEGSWKTDSHDEHAPSGRTYTTSLVVLTLAAPNQLLPVFQR